MARTTTMAAVVLALWPVIKCGEPGEGQPEPLDRAEQVTQRFSKWNRPDAPGCAVGIVQDGKLVYCRGFGSANLDSQAPNTPATVFLSASMTKTFTCACIALLLDQGRISPEDDIRKYVPELHQNAKPIRIRHLIRCETGLWDCWHLQQLAGWSAEPVESPMSADDVLALLAGQRSFAFEPAKFHYSSSDYFLLGLVVQRVTGKSLTDFARDNLFRPLGMTRTYYEVDPTRVVRDRATGYYLDPPRTGEWRAWSPNATVVGGGGLRTCVDDLARWDLNAYDSRLPRGKHLDELLTEGTLLGNRNVLDATPTGRYRGAKRIQSTGGMPGFLAALVRFPEQKFTVICLSNNSTEINPWKMAWQIADLYLGDRLEPPPAQPAVGATEKKAATVSEADLRNKVGSYQNEYGVIFRITVEGGSLWNTNHIGEHYKLHPLSPTEFRPDPYPEDTFVFERPAPAEPFSLTLKADGGSWAYPRVELVDPATLNLEEYSGQYYSDELMTTYRILKKGDHLWLRVNSERWERLDPTVRDTFVPQRRHLYDNRVIAFRRDAKRQVAGLSAALWRVRGVAFEKRE
jgi:CubicO group peptidase (beta-lactamase class C family)